MCTFSELEDIIHWLTFKYIIEPKISFLKSSAARKDLDNYNIYCEILHVILLFKIGIVSTLCVSEKHNLEMFASDSDLF